MFNALNSKDDKSIPSINCKSVDSEITTRSL